MNIVELKQLIADSAEQQRVFKNPYSSFDKYLEAGQGIIKTKPKIVELEKRGKLDIDVKILKDNIKQFLDSQKIVIPTAIAKKKYIENLLIGANEGEINSLVYVSLLRIVPSYLHYNPQEKIELLRDYPNAIDVIYDSLLQTKRAIKTNETTINF